MGCSLAVGCFLKGIRPDPARQLNLYWAGRHWIDGEKQMYNESMKYLSKKDRKSVSTFFNDYQWNYLPESIMEGFVGEVLVDEIASVATTAVICNKGIEIQINTRQKYQQKGLATVTAAQLLLHSLQRGLDPNWDAANLRSARLAKKLGYTSQGIYTMWFLNGS